MARLASRQHGVVARRQLLALGFTRDAIKRRLAQGRLHRLHPGVYVVGRPQVSDHGRWNAAVLACGTGALLSHRSAASLWGLLHTEGAAVEVTAPGRHRHLTQPKIHLYQPRSLTDADRAIRNGIPVTSVARTLLDLAAVVSSQRLRHAFEQAERLGVFHLPEVAAVVDCGRGRTGVAKLRALLVEATEPPDLRSELERRFLDFCREAGVPPPATNCIVAGHTVDALWLRRRLVVELDGFAYHRSRTAFERDRRRDLDLQLDGYRVVRVTARQLERDTRELASALRALLDQQPATGRSGERPQPPHRGASDEVD